MARNDGSLQRMLLKVAKQAARQLLDRSARGQQARKSPPRSDRSPATAETARGTSDYPGDFRGNFEAAYNPELDGDPDPGEIVWTWVPYEEDHSQGKDRPVLLIGLADGWLLGLQLTSKDHDRDNEDEARSGRYWIDIGTGAWDTQGRASEVRVNRIIRIDPTKVRREGAILDRHRFDAVIEAVRTHQ